MELAADWPGQLIWLIFNKVGIHFMLLPSWLILTIVMTASIRCTDNQTYSNFFKNSPKYRPHLYIKTVYPGRGIQIIKIKWSWDLIFIMGIPILPRGHLNIEIALLADCCMINKVLKITDIQITSLWNYFVPHCGQVVLYGETDLGQHGLR